MIQYQKLPGFKNYMLALDGFCLAKLAVPYLPHEGYASCLADAIDPRLEEAFWAYQKSVDPQRLVAIIANRYGFVECCFKSPLDLELHKWASRRNLWASRPGCIGGYIAEDVDRRYKMKMYAIAERARARCRTKPPFRVDVIDVSTETTLKSFDRFDIESAYRDAQKYVRYQLKQLTLRCIAPSSNQYAFAPNPIRC